MHLRLTVSSCLLAPLFLTACAGHVGGTQVEGKMLHTPETFQGSSNSGVEGNGTLSVVSDKGVKCRGPYRLVPDNNQAEVNPANDESGVATLTCDDGRTGSVYFQIGTDQAVGTGMLGTDIVTLTMNMDE